MTNAAAYAQALKDYVAEDMQVLLFDYSNWDAGSRGWYNMPWLTAYDSLNQPAASNLREPIMGTYVGSTGIPAEMFPRSGLTAPITTHVLVYFDEVAASSLQDVWGTTALHPMTGLNTGQAQFAEGGIVVKPALVTADANIWPPMQGAFTRQIYSPAAGSPMPPPSLQDVSLFQFDIIVKDSLSAPNTGWVFTTLVYDGSVDGDAWDKLVVLGAMWGADTNVDSPVDCDYLTPGDCPALSETWINPDAPLYSKETLGWGGRLSGPNDGAVDINAAVQTSPGVVERYAGRYAMSSCMSCHSSAEYKLGSFLLPSPAVCDSDNCAPTLVYCANAPCTTQVPAQPQFSDSVRIAYYPTGSGDFMAWFQDRTGDEPMNPPNIALDYGMNYAFKALPQWFKNTGQGDENDLPFIEHFNDYRGRPSTH